MTRRRWFETPSRPLWRHSNADEICLLAWLNFIPDTNENHIQYKVGNKTINQFPNVQYIPRNMHTVFALLCFVVVIHWLVFPYPSGLLHWHCGNLTIAPVPARQPWWIWINTSCEFIMNDCITTTKQSTTKPCAYFLGYTVNSATVEVYIRIKQRDAINHPCPNFNCASEIRAGMCNCIPHATVNVITYPFPI